MSKEFKLKEWGTDVPYGIKTPTNVDEFRQNLIKYYCISSKEYIEGCKSYRDYPIDKINLLTSGEYQDIPITKISSFDDIYRLTKSGFHGDGSSPCITPMVHMKTDIGKWMRKTNQIMSFHGYFQYEENFELFEDQNEFISSDMGDPMWISLDNQIWREFYMITLGEFCGYEYKPSTK